MYMPATATLIALVQRTVSTREKKVFPTSHICIFSNLKYLDKNLNVMFDLVLGHKCFPMCRFC